MATLTDSVMEILIAATASACEVVGGEIVYEIQEALSDVLTYRVGPRGGLTPLRSKPGEPPRHEFGNYYRSIGLQVAVAGDFITLTVNSDDWQKKVMSLEYGNSRGLLPRPVFVPAFERWSSRFVDRLAESIQNSIFYN